MSLRWWLQHRCSWEVKHHWAGLISGWVSWAGTRPVHSCHIRADSRFAPSQWDTALFCNNISHWLESALHIVLIASQSTLSITPQMQLPGPVGAKLMAVLILHAVAVGPTGGPTVINGCCDKNSLTAATDQLTVYTLIVRFMGPTWGPSEADRTQVGPMLAP